MKQVRKRLTYANVMSSLAVFLVLGGATAFAANQLGKNTVGTKQLKPNAVTAAKIKKGAVGSGKIADKAVTEAKLVDGAVTGAKVKDGSLTGADINLGSLGTVPSATNAGTAASLNGLVRKTLRLTASPEGATQSATQAASPEVPLFTIAPFTVYAKCFNYGSRTYGHLFIKTSENGVAFESDEDSLAGDPFLDVATPEEDRELQEESAASGAASIDANHTPEFGAFAPGGVAVRGETSVAVKQGDLPGGNGVYGAGDVCLFNGVMINTSS